jgi:hypothetical protein
MRRDNLLIAISLLWCVAVAGAMIYVFAHF